MVQTLPKNYAGIGSPLGIPLTWASDEIAAADGDEKVLIDMSAAANATKQVAVAYFVGSHGAASALGETHLYSETATTSTPEFNWYGYYSAPPFTLDLYGAPWRVGVPGDDLMLERIVTTGVFHWLVGYFLIQT